MLYTTAIGLTFIGFTVIGVIGNLMVLFVIAMNKQLHDCTNILIANLAVADLLFLTFCPPVSAYAYMYGWDFSETMCYVTVSLQYLTCYVSVWTLGLLAFDRYQSITRPTRPKTLRRGYTVYFAIAALWILSFLINLPQMRNVGVLSFFQSNNTEDVVLICVDSTEIAREVESVTGARYHYWGFNVVAYLLPLFLCTVFYFLLVKHIWEQRLVTSRSSMRMKRHATRMVFAVILTFGICWFPQNFRFFMRGLDYPTMSFWEYDIKSLVVIQSIAQTLGYANSCINPILYGLLSERFRTGFTRAMARLPCCFWTETTLHSKYSEGNRTLLTPLNGSSARNMSRVGVPYEEVMRKSIPDEQMSNFPRLSGATLQTTIFASESDKDGSVILL
uniref:G_PROTEIN_RECEP_F1_2 domain-containing protein n=1 Tax=Panagrellus redivivus TaxID=6233 RepID=A0A7E4VES2_PANRE